MKVTLIDDHIQIETKGLSASMLVHRGMSPVDSLRFRAAEARDQAERLKRRANLYEEAAAILEAAK